MNTALAVVFAIAAGVLVTAALRVRSTAGGPRRVWVALRLAGLAVLPGIPTFWLGWQWFGLHAVSAGATPPDGLLVVLSAVQVTMAGVGSLRLPRAFGDPDRLPRVDDPQLLERIDGIARQLGLTRPEVLQAGSSGPSQQVYAFASGLLAPVVLLSDGIAGRLPAAERDAIVAHELAHLARHSIWRYLGAMALASLLAVLVSTLVPVMVAVTFLLAAQWFGRILVGHGDEVAADRRGARCTDHGAMARALDKTHAVNQQLASGRGAAWFHALMTHPAMALRALRLRQDAPAEQRAGIEVDEAQAGRCVRTRRLAVVLVTLLMGGMVWLGMQPGWEVPATLTLFLLSMMPSVLLLLFFGELRENWRLGIGRQGRILCGRLGLLGVGLALMLVTISLRPGGRDLAPVLSLAMLGVVVAAFAYGRREMRLLRELDQRLRARDLAGHRTVLQKAPDRLRRRPQYRVLAALVAAELGDAAAALPEFLAIRAAHPRCHLATFWAAALVLPQDSARAVALLRELDRVVPGHAQVLAALAGALLRDGRRDEAAALLAQVLRQRPRQGIYRALAVRVELAAGRTEAAAAELALAERYAPGDVATVLARAEFALRAGAAEGAALLATAREQARKAPFAFHARALGAELAREFGVAAAAGG